MLLLLNTAQEAAAPRESLHYLAWQASSQCRHILTRKRRHVHHHRRFFYGGYYPYYATYYPRCRIIYTYYGPRRVCGYRHWHHRRWYRRYW